MEKAQGARNGSTRRRHIAASGTALVRGTRDRQTKDAHQAIPRLKPVNRTRVRGQEFAICVRSDDVDLLTPRRIYEVLPDHGAARSRYLRVIDNEGEDYLYPAVYFIRVSLPAAVKRAVRAAT